MMLKDNTVVEGLAAEAEKAKAGVRNAENALARLHIILFYIKFLIKN